MRSGDDWVNGARFGGHRLGFVYTEMLRQVVRDYHSLPDPRTLTLTDIRFWYEGLRPELKHVTKPRPTAPRAVTPALRPRLRRP